MHGDRSDVTDDAILNGRLRLLQPRRGHRFGHDAILLAAAVPAERGQRVAEFGAGVGAASLALLARVPDLDATLFEIDETLCALARENIARNNFSHRACAIAFDVASGDSVPAAAAGAFDHIFMNPPFNDGSLQPSPDSSRRKAHAGDARLLQNWVDRAEGMLSAHGTATLIWRADGAADVINVLSRGFGAMTLIPVYPAPDRAAIRVIASGRKDDRSALRILPPLILNDRNHRATEAADNLLRHGGRWPPETDR